MRIRSKIQNVKLGLQVSDNLDKQTIARIQNTRITTSHFHLSPSSLSGVRNETIHKQTKKSIQSTTVVTEDATVTIRVKQKRNERIRR